jgi:hypothetical protein
MENKTYRISRYSGLHTDVNWENVESAAIDCLPWEEYNKFYPSFAKVVCFDDGLSVRLSSKEPNPTSNCAKLNDLVCTDSCLEFFLQPSLHDNKYFNFELNPSGVMFLGLGTCRGDNRKLWIDDYSGLFEIKTCEYDGYWSVTFFIPFNFIKQYISNFDAASSKMRGNFYKCGDKTPIPHYICWNKVITEYPDFHRPEYFGDLVIV